VAKANSRVQELISGRRAGTVSTEAFEARIEQFSSEEVAELVETVLEKSRITRQRLKRDLLHYLATATEPE
jgi:hypothetical protein